MIKTITENPWTELAARCFLGGTFLYACLSKLVHPEQFAKIIYGYGLFPDFSINLIAIVIPWIEFVAATALILGVYPSAGVLLINVMLFFYMAAISINLIRGHEFDCGCFSMEGNSEITPTSLLFRDVFYFGIGLLVLFYSKKRKKRLFAIGGFWGKKASL